MQSRGKGQVRRSPGATSTQCKDGDQDCAGAYKAHCQAHLLYSLVVSSQMNQSEMLLEGNSLWTTRSCCCNSTNLWWQLAPHLVHGNSFVLLRSRIMLQHARSLITRSELKDRTAAFLDALRADGCILGEGPVCGWSGATEWSTVRRRHADAAVGSSRSPTPRLRHSAYELRLERIGREG
jgi:hypothetical protein